ncbi:MAG TPA: universal stress protein [Chloroflexota bacterium]|jgi:nucleotide-binding universal stress UspA family protein
MLRRILVPLDGRRDGLAAVPALRWLVGGTGAVVHLLAVRPQVRRPEHSGDRLIYLDELRLQERAHWLDYLTREASHLAYDGIVVQREVRFGDPLAETLAAAERHAMQLIVLAARPQTWLERLWRPHLAQQLLAHAAIPVLTVPAERPYWQGVAVRYSAATAQG